MSTFVHHARLSRPRRPCGSDPSVNPRQKLALAGLAVSLPVVASDGAPAWNRQEATLIGTEEADSKASPNVDATADPGAPFAALGLSPLLVEALVNVGYNQPTEIQRLGIPAALGGTDVLGTAHTGTGKTAAFTLPMIQRLARLPGCFPGPSNWHSRSAKRCAVTGPRRPWKPLSCTAGPAWDRKSPS